MKELLELSEEIREFRSYMHSLLSKKQDLLDPEIIAASKVLDDLLSEYENELERRRKNGKSSANKVKSDHL